MTLTKLHRIGSAALGLAAVLASVSVSLAFVHSEPNSRYEVPLREFDMFNYSNPVTVDAREQAMTAMSVRNGGDWQTYSWNSQTGTPTMFWGSGVDVAPAFSSANEVVAAAHGLIAQNPTVFKAQLANLRVKSTPEGLGKRSVIFQQTYKGIDVWGGRVRLTFMDSGRFFAGGSDFYQGINLDTRPSIPVSVAEDIAKRDLPFNPSTDSIDLGSRLLIVPVPVSETQVEYHLTWRVKVRTQDPVGTWVTHVDASTGQVVWRFNDVHFVNFTGDADGNVEEETYCNGTTNQPTSYLRVQIAGVGNTTSDVNGNWSLIYGGNDTRGLTADLYGPYVDLNNVAGAEATFTGSATPGVPAHIEFSNLNSQADERDVFNAVNDIHDFFQQVDPGFAYANTRINANVRVSGTCNAFWNGTINFYAAGGGCANTGEIQGVVHHEFGHGVQDAIIGGQGSQGLGEGNADILANLMTQESIIGRGFNTGNCTGGIRNSNNNLRYPEAVVGQEEHSAGQVIAGVNWDVMQRFQSSEGVSQGTVHLAELWHFGRMLETPTNQPDQVASLFIADDDNGNLNDGTPNYDDICFAAFRHGFSCPTITVGVFITHTPLGTTTTPGSYNVDATITTTGGSLVADSTYTAVSLNGAPYSKILMSNIGPNLYRATLPFLNQGTEVRYWIKSQNTLGQSKTSPIFAPEFHYDFDIATVYDPQEVANTWVVNPDGSDNASTGIWTRVNPNGTGAQPEDDHTADPGVMCWVTGQGAVGGGLGDQDVDGGTTTLRTSNYDLTGFAVAKLKLFYWYSNDQGATPGTDTWLVRVRNNGGPWQNILSTMTSTNSWTALSDDLVARFGAGSLGQIQVQFVASDLNDGSLVEAAVDDFEVLANSGAAVPGPLAGTELRFALAGAVPNPSAGLTSIQFAVPTSVPVQITMFDVSGRAVRTLAKDNFAAGLHTIEWDGRDNAGHAVASGVYYYRMTAPSFNATRTLVVQH